MPDDTDIAAPRGSSPEGPSGIPAADVVYKPSNLPPGPWIYRKMIQPPRAGIPNGTYTGLRSRRGELLARGILNRRSTIAFRVLGDRNAPEDFKELLMERLASARNLRTKILHLPRVTDAWRLVSGEGDGLSGLVVDVYGPVAVAAIYSIGYIANAEILETALLSQPGIEKVIFRADKRTRELEGFHLPGPGKVEEVVIKEHGISYSVLPGTGHKTGFFLDQRDNRLLFGRLAGGGRVLDLCTNAGGFALNAAVRGRPRDVTGVDLDEKVLARARKNARLNRASVTFEHADIFPWLRQKIEAGNRFSLVSLDPAGLARDRTKKHEALKGYLDMNALAMRIINAGGLLLTSSCTGCVSEEEFIHVLQQAARNAGRRARILEVRGAAPDHPVSLDFLEGRYLKTVLLQVL